MILQETMELNNGVSIPKLGLGTWLMEDAEAERAVIDAVKIGYRHIDTAQAYGNEAGVGRGVRACGVPREDLFVVSKVAAEHKDYDSAAQSIDQTLSTMGLDYLDMMIIHSPQPWMDVNQSDDRFFEGNVEAYRALEDALRAGKLRAIGVSNFQQGDLENILANCSVVPQVNQVLCHVGNTPLHLIEFDNDHNIVTEAYSPVAHGAILDNSTVAAIADKYNVSVPQLCIRYCLQLDCVTLPKTSNPAHMATNAEVDFVISPEDMSALESVGAIDYGDASAFPVYGGKL
ncbi:aldo/keto reductase [Anaerotardibacter muris]|uniref:aldo/keto reductase n=1 Tax=Anaerotardibacter muris TaxID=2941505 RepID=UPI00203BFE7E|nr:aldo/keto reductase [Anaerotardibacter muris]